jgi:tetratricopeptide (TPR) repeat protein
MMDYLQMVKKTTDLDPNDAVFRFRVGVLHRLSKHHEDALRIFKEVETQLQDCTALVFYIAQAYLDVKNFQAALDYLQKVKRLYDPSSDAMLKSVYWEMVLLREGDCYRELKDYSKAVTCYRYVLDQRHEAMGTHHEVLAALFGLWAELGDHNSIIQFLREKKVEDDIFHWLNLGFEDQKNVHGRILKAAKHTGTIEEVCQMYDAVIKPQVNGDVSIRVPANPEFLRFFRAALVIQVAGLLCTREDILEDLQELSQASVFDTLDAYWMAFNARKLLAGALLDGRVACLSKLEDPTTDTSYVARLEALSRQQDTQIRPSHYDTTLSLVRLHILDGNTSLADEEAKIILRGVFDNWPYNTRDSTLRRRYAVLAQVLTIYNMDDDAIAAWQILKPRKVEVEVPDWLFNVDEHPEQVPSPTTVTATLDVESSPDGQESISYTQEAQGYISGYLCDACVTPWDDMLTDCWACRQCVCCQLCTPCHEKLLADDLDPLICSKNHEFLYLPNFDKELWSSVPNDQILVGGKLISRDQWLNTFREKWGVQQEQIDAYKLETARQLKAAIYIKSFVLRWRRRRADKQKQK